MARAGSRNHLSYIGYAIVLVSSVFFGTLKNPFPALSSFKNLCPWPSRFHVLKNNKQISPIGHEASKRICIIYPGHKIIT